MFATRPGTKGSCFLSANYRIPYFFLGRNVAALNLALTKEDKIPKADLERALRRKKACEAAPETHTLNEPV